MVHLGDAAAASQTLKTLKDCIADSEPRCLALHLRIVCPCSEMHLLRFVFQARLFSRIAGNESTMLETTLRISQTALHLASDTERAALVHRHHTHPLTHNCGVLGRGSGSAVVLS